MDEVDELAAKILEFLSDIVPPEAESSLARQVLERALEKYIEVEENEFYDKEDSIEVVNNTEETNG